MTVIKIVNLVKISFHSEKILSFILENSQRIRTHYISFIQFVTLDKFFRLLLSEPFKECEWGIHSIPKVKFHKDLQTQAMLASQAVRTKL